MDFFDSLKDETAKNEELADGAQFFVGMKKQAYGDIACSPPGSSSPAKGWIGLFEGSPLLQQALALERQELTMEAEDIAKRQQERSESDGRMRMDQQRWDLRDQIRIKKRELELTLAEQQMGGSGEPEPEMQAGAAPSESALPKPEAGVASAVAPAMQGDMPKLASYPVKEYVKHISSGLAKGGLMGAGAGAAGAGIPAAFRAKNQPKGQKLKYVGKEMARGGVLGAGIVGGLHGLKRTIDVRRNVKDIKDVRGLLAQMDKGDHSFLKNANAADAIGKVLTYKHTPAIAGALAGGLYLHHRSKSRPELKGKSKDEVSSEKDLQSAEAASPEGELGFTGKMNRQVSKAMPGVSRVLREHPVKATILGAGLGARTAQQLVPILGRGVEKLKNISQARRQLQLFR